MVGKCSATDLSPSNPEGLDFSRKSFRGGALKKSVGTAGKNQPDVHGWTISPLKINFHSMDLEVCRH